MVFSIDLGIITTGVRNGQQVAAIVNLATGTLGADFYAVAPTNSSTILLPVLAADVGITAANPRLNYTVAAFDLLSDDQDAFSGTAITPARGLMIVTQDNKNGPREADLITVAAVGSK